MEKNRSPLTGYLLGALAAASYGTNPLFALPLLNAGIDAFSVLFLRYVFALPMLALIMKARGRGFGLRRTQLLPLVALGLLMAASSLTLYVSYAYIGAAIASTLLFIYPILVTIIMAVFFHERASMVTIFSILLATTGIGLLYRGEGGVVLSPTGLLLVFLSALSYAIYLVWVNGRSIREIPTLKLTFYVIFFGLFLFAFRFDVHTFAILNAQPLLWLSALSMALFPTALSLLCTSAAIQRIGSTPVAIMGALEPVTAVAIAVLLFSEVLTPRLAIGMLLVIVAVTLIIGGPTVSRYVLRVRKMFPRLRHRK
ncbi:MAG: DMT family transporter [Prevotella sp.]|nr:DMT family transporter [Prevotella sp.]